MFRVRASGAQMFDEEAIRTVSRTTEHNNNSKHKELNANIYGSDYSKLSSSKVHKSNA
jgi:hypothetical protein